MKIRFLYIFISSLFLYSCSESYLNPEKYISWVENSENGLHKDKQVGDLIFDVQYRPTDYVLCKSGELDEFVSPNMLDSLRGRYDSTLFFSIILKGINGKDPLTQYNNGLEAALYYFQFQFQKDIYITQGNETANIYPVLFHFERFYTVNNSKMFLVAFDKKNISNEEDIKLVIDSKHLSSGFMQFSFNKKIIKDQPHIKL